MGVRADENLRLSRAFLAHTLATVLAALTAFALMASSFVSTVLWQVFRVSLDVGESMVFFVASFLVVPLTAMFWLLLASRRALPKGLPILVALAAVVCATSSLIINNLLIVVAGGHGVLLLPAMFGAIIGAFYGAVFWLIRRPDRDAPANPVTPSP